MLGWSSRVLPRICACSMMHFASQTKKHWDLAESKLNMAASPSYNASWRWKELPSLVPQQERKWQLIDIVPSILCYLLFMVLVWKMWLAKRLENFPKETTWDSQSNTRGEEVLDGHIESFIFASSYFKLRSKPVILSDYSEILIVLYTVLRDIQILYSAKEPSLLKPFNSHKWRRQKFSF